MSFQDPRARRLSPWPFVGLGLLACLAFLDGASAYFLPRWAVLGLYAVWLVLVVIACRVFGTAPGRVLPIALVGLGLWLAVVVIAAVSAAV